MSEAKRSTGKPRPGQTEETSSADTDMEAFYAAQKVSATDSRDYAARRRQH